MHVRPFAWFAAFLAAVAVGTFVAPREALATREYAKAEGKECAYCHVSPKGSGPRNPTGQEYEANGHKFGVKSWSNAANETKFLRASSAIVAQWYAEANRLLDELVKEETLPGGVALTSAIRDKFKMFKHAWLDKAKALIADGDRRVPVAVTMLTKVESQYEGADEGKEAVKILDGLAKDAKTKDVVAAARATEKARQLLLEGRTEFQLGRADRAKELFDKALADPRSKPFENEIREAVAALAPAK
jgi:hypothetical protein